MKAFHIARTIALPCAMGLAACAPHASTSAPQLSSAPSAVAPDVTLVSDEGVLEPLRARVARSPYTVFLYFASHCPVQKAHDARVRALAEAYAPRGVAFVGLSTEDESDLHAENAAATARGLPFPIAADRAAALANAEGVEFSTHAILVDRTGRILYSGGLDSDRSHVTADATPHLQNALDDVLAGKAVRRPAAEALGCPLRKP